MDKMVSIKGLVIRTTPVIPDMKTGESVPMDVRFIFPNDYLSFLPVPSLQPRSQGRT